MDSDQVAQFMSITDTTYLKAKSYLKLNEYNLEQALQLFFETGGADLEATPPTPSAPPPLPARLAASSSNDPIVVDDDDDDDDIRQAIRASESASAAAPPLPARSGAVSYEDDEAMARRLQEELYGSGGGASGIGGGVRAPMARTTETLVGPDADDGYGYPLLPPVRIRHGIFNQRATVWENRQPGTLTSEEHRRRLAQATAGASERTSHAGRLAELFRPPVEIITHLPFEHARDEAREQQKWVLVNIQDESVFTSQVLNRDIWRDATVQQTIKENFIFLQMNRKGMDGKDYIRLYLPDVNSGFASNTFPHIAIIDPRTGEQVKIWKMMPKTPMEFVHTLHEFLERYSLNEDSRNPVQRPSKPNTAPVDIERMTEDEMLQLAMQNSLDAAVAAAGNSSGSSTGNELSREEEEPDLMEFERSPSPKGKQVTEQTPFQKIARDRHHQEPPPGPQTTRIQFKLHDGSRVVRRFLLKDTVERLFEYVKADLLPEKEAGKEDQEFDLVSLGKRLIEVLELTVEEAGLKMGTVMVEATE